MGEVRFKEWHCTVEKAAYGNGRTALILRDAEDGGQVAVATVNLPGVAAGPDEVFIKDYSENEGMFAGLERAGIVRATGENAARGPAGVFRASLMPPYRDAVSIERRPGRDESGRARTNKAIDRSR